MPPKMDCVYSAKQLLFPSICDISSRQRFALTFGGRGLYLGAEKSQGQIPLQMRPVHIKSLLKFQCRIWGHRTRSVASGRVSKGRVGPVHALLGGVTIFYH